MKKLPDFFRKRRKITSSTSGQALLIILLIMAVGLTIGLSITSRSITDIKISELSEEGARAFSAAEAGIEEALLAGTEGTFPGEFEAIGAEYVAETSGFGEGTEFAFPSTVDRNQVQTLWLAKHDDLSQAYYDRKRLRVVWGNPGEEPALEVSVYYNDAGTYKVAKFAIDPDDDRALDNWFCNPNSKPEACDGIDYYSDTTEKVDGKDFHFGARLDLRPFRGAGKILLFARLRILYVDDQPLGAKAAGDGSKNFPSQGIGITSTGTAGEATRKVRVVRYHPAPPPFFDMVLYSQQDLAK